MGCNFDFDLVYENDMVEDGSLIVFVFFYGREMEEIMCIQVECFKVFLVCVKVSGGVMCWIGEFEFVCVDVVVELFCYLYQRDIDNVLIFVEQIVEECIDQVMQDIFWSSLFDQLCLMLDINGLLGVYNGFI